MSDDNKTGENEQIPAVTTPQNNSELPEWARKEISNANSEAAKYRTERNNIEAELTAKLTADFDNRFKLVSDEKSAITAERDSAASELTKLKVALTAGIPGETAVKFASLLQGSNTEELTAHAEELKGMFGSPGKSPRPIDPSHGASGQGAQDGASQFAALIQKHLSK